MGRPRRSCRRGGGHKTPCLLALAFGAGLFLILVCGLKLIVLIAAILLIVMGLWFLVRF